jgi:hypothetical protein
MSIKKIEKLGNFFQTRDASELCCKVHEIIEYLEKQEGEKSISFSHEVTGKTLATNPPQSYLEKRAKEVGRIPLLDEVQKSAVIAFLRDTINQVLEIAEGMSKTRLHGMTVVEAIEVSDLRKSLLGDNTK